MRARCSAARGVTLIELVIALAIIVVISANISFVPAERRRVVSAALELQSDIRYIQRIALTEGRRAQITFNQADISYILEKWENGKFTRIKRTALGPAVDKLFTNASGASVRFTPRGTTGDACTINLSSGRYTASLTVNVGAGRVKIVEIIKRPGGK